MMTFEVTAALAATTALVFAAMLFWAFKPRNENPCDQEMPDVPEQFWRDRYVTRVKSNGEEKDV